MKTYTTVKKNKKIKVNAGRQFLVCLFWLALWQILTLFIGNDLLLPGPWQTAAAFLSLVKNSRFYLDIFWTLFRCLAAMSISIVIGTIGAWRAYKNTFLRNLIAVPVGFFKAVPVMAIIIYVILLASAGKVAIIVCVLMCFPVVYTNILSGLDAMSCEFLELAQIYELTPFQKIKYIYAPGIYPQIESAVRLISGLSWKAVVAAEVLSIPKYSLGYEMLSAKYYLETPTLFAYILTIVVSSISLEKLIDLWLRHMESSDYEGSRLSMPKKTLVHGANPPQIAIAGLFKGYDDKLVLDDVSMNFDEGKTTVIMGASGQGKTTLARLIAGLESPDKGNIVFTEEKELSYLFQEDRLIPWLNVYDNLALSLLRNGKTENTSQKNDAIVEMAKLLEIDDVLWKLPRELSGGMRHRVALGRTFLAKSNVMILDEPFRGLDENLKHRIIERLWEGESKGKTVIVITHNPQDAKLLGGTVKELVHSINIKM